MLHPVQHNVLVTQIVLVLQIVKRNHQPRRDARRALRGMIRRPQRFLKRCPVDAQPQTNLRMIEIDYLFQFRLEQLTLRLIGLSDRAHDFPQVM